MAFESKNYSGKTFKKIKIGKGLNFDVFPANNNTPDDPYTLFFSKNKIYKPEQMTKIEEIKFKMVFGYNYNN